MNPLMGRKVKRAAWELQSNYLLSELHMKKLAQRLTFTHTDNNEVIIPLMFFQVHNLKTRFQYLPYSLERQNSWLQRPTIFTTTQPASMVPLIYHTKSQVCELIMKESISTYPFYPFKEQIKHINRFQAWISEAAKL